MIDVVCDASIVLKWFHEEGEAEVDEARAVLAAHQSGLVTAWVLDLTFYELGNVLLRSLGWKAADVAAQLDDLTAICATLAPDMEDRRLAAHLASDHGLTFYDAIYAAVAQLRDATLVTADRALLQAGGVSPGEMVSRLRT